MTCPMCDGTGYKDHAGLSMDPCDHSLPAGHWSSEEGVEIVRDYAQKTRADLCMGNLTDFELANAQFLVGRWDLQLVAYQTAAKERIRWLSTKLQEANILFAELRGRQTLPLVNQHGVTVGTEHISFADLHRREVHVDERGTVWSAPTAWAYMQVCKSLERVRYGTPSGEDLRDALSDIIQPIHWETWKAALFSDHPEGWPDDDAQEAIARRVDSMAVGEHWEAWGREILDQVIKLIEEIRAGRSPASPQEVTLTEIHPAPTEFNPEQLAQDNILRYFHYAHLPEKLQAASKPFCDLARHIVETLPRNPERTVALRKLLEAKDAGVRANVQ